MAAASQGLSMSSSSHDNGRENFRERLLDIDYNLGDLEVEQLKFLCQDLVSRKNLEKCSSASDIFEHLLARKLLSEEDPFLLAELLYIIKQNSLLKYLHYTKEQVENLLPTKRKVSLFRNLLYEMSENIDSEILKSMIFLQKESMPKIQMVSRSYTMESLCTLTHSVFEKMLESVFEMYFFLLETVSYNREEHRFQRHVGLVLLAAPLHTRRVPEYL